MKAINNANRYYCHRRLQSGRVLPRQKTVYLHYQKEPDKYAKRLKEVYNYQIQLEL